MAAVAPIHVDVQMRTKPSRRQVNQAVVDALVEAGILFRQPMRLPQSYEGGTRYEDKVVYFVLPFVDEEL